MINAGFFLCNYFSYTNSPLTALNRLQPISFECIRILLEPYISYAITALIRLKNVFEEIGYVKTIRNTSYQQRAGIPFEVIC